MTTIYRGDLQDYLRRDYQAAARQGYRLATTHRKEAAQMTEPYYYNQLADMEQEKARDYARLARAHARLAS